MLNNYESIEEKLTEVEESIRQLRSGSSYSIPKITNKDFDYNSYKSELKLGPFEASSPMCQKYEPISGLDQCPMVPSSYDYMYKSNDINDFEFRNENLYEVLPDIQQEYLDRNVLKEHNKVFKSSYDKEECINDLMMENIELASQVNKLTKEIQRRPSMSTIEEVKERIKIVEGKLNQKAKPLGKPEIIQRLKVIFKAKNCQDIQKKINKMRSNKRHSQRIALLSEELTRIAFEFDKKLGKTTSLNEILDLIGSIVAKNMKKTYNKKQSKKMIQSSQVNEPKTLLSCIYKSL